VYRRQSEIFGHRVHQRGGQEPLVLMLRGGERLQYRRTLVLGRKARNPVVDLATGVLVQQISFRITVAAH
jgi:hypothetical protein